LASQALGTRSTRRIFPERRQGLQMVIAGVVLGLLGALAFTRVLESILFQLSARDPRTFLSVTLILVAVAVVACYIPARRAMRVDPIVALRLD
jgi:putative ABC transport system permease protein